MLNIIIISIVLGSIIALATLICGTILIIVKARGSQYSSGADDGEVAKIIQETFQRLERFEQRIESLETILEDQKVSQDNGNKGEQL